MDNYKLTMNIEPTDKYQKAKQDLAQALYSIQNLTPLQQRQLAEEFFGAARVAAVIDILQQHFGRSE